MSKGARRWRKMIALHERDGGFCRLCGGEIVLSRLGKQNPDKPTLDHILPKAKGGTNDLENLQLAHAKCNTAKGHKDDYALIKGEEQ